MAATGSVRPPRATNPSSGISSFWRTICSGASAAWARACRCRSRPTAGASSGWRTKAPRRISPRSTCPIRASRKSSANRPAARQHALELAGDLREYDGGRLSDLEKGSAARGLRAVRYFQTGKSQIDFVFRLLRAAFARRAPALVLRRRIRALRVRIARFRADAPAGRPVLPLRRRAQPLEAGGSRPLVDAGHATRR